MHDIIYEGKKEKKKKRERKKEREIENSKAQLKKESERTKQKKMRNFYLLNLLRQQLLLSWYLFLCYFL
jgi:hypothetical protein